MVKHTFSLIQRTLLVGASLVLLLLTTASKSYGQQDGQPKIEMRGCNEQSSPLPPLHPGSKFKLCLTFAGDLATNTSVYVDFVWSQLSTTESSDHKGIPAIGPTSFSNRITVGAPTKQIEVPLEIPATSTTGVFSLNTVQLQDSKHGYANTTLPEPRLKIEVEQTEHYEFPQLRSATVEP
jgi:hypothetical protein